MAARSSPGGSTAERLKGVSVLAVEDDFFLLIDLEAALRDAGAEPVHPCRTIREAFAVLDSHEIEAAILDVRIGRDTIAPVADALAKRSVPFVFYTGQIAGDEIISAWSDHPVLAKPAPPRAVVQMLTSLVHKNRDEVFSPHLIGPSPA